ncbi:exodeoxyribonuclease V subunit alpha [Candidatus Albibeggiatoa sp. nov. BB20]|uniref:exodeoxyribonuclease V subunit alpha n=1 Tax=Candidatus Albibeggiatoa sp. nov. BB20 TaxID=3162723 RepID=UPI00336537B0
MLQQIQHLHQQGIFSSLDVHLAVYLQKLAGVENDEFLLAAVLTSYFTTQGHICINLSELANTQFPIENDADIEPIQCPDFDSWQQALDKHPMIGQANEFKPLVLDKNLLYLYRYWQYEQQLGHNILQRVAQTHSDSNQIELHARLEHLFPTQDDDVDWQKMAAKTAVLKNFCIISGGPGTGKTTTVVKILLLLLQENPKLRIALAAPTGKAATRLQQAIQNSVLKLNFPPELLAAIPQDTYTIHRLLGTIPKSPYFRFHAQNPLPYDVVIVDEASMVDLALMAKLADAIPQASRWLLLGDKDQLASVEAGSVLGDICTGLTLDSEAAIREHIVLLEKSYRFHEKSGIGVLARYLQQGQAEQALKVVQQGKFNDISWQQIASPHHLSTQLASVVTQGFASYLQASSPSQALDYFEQFRVLCALRHGAYGVENLNRLIEQILINQGQIQSGYRWYHGRPIMITRNDYTLKLFNGDIGIILWNSEGELMAYFRYPDGEIRSLYPHRLPEHETVYAMTIHKSQGSEFDDFLMLLPDKTSPVLNRELIYTGITRAKQSVSIWGDEQVFLQAAHQTVERQSGLMRMLYQC